MTPYSSTKHSLSTETLPGPESIKAWREYLAEVYCRQDVKLVNSDRALGSISSRTVGDMIISGFRSGGAQRVVRTKELAKFDHIEHFHFVFPQAGMFSHQQGAVEGCASAGETFILNASRDFRIDFSDDAESLVFAVPCEIIRKRIIGFDDFVVHHKLSDPLLIHIMSNMAKTIINIDSGVDGFKLQETCIDLFDLAVADARSHSIGLKSASAFSDLLADRIRVVIGERCAKVNFSLADLAVACGVSKRHIQKTLSDRNTTFGLELLNSRLTKAAHLLKTRNKSAVTIGQIAAQCGFASQSHFSTCYRNRFGMSPREEQ